MFYAAMEPTDEVSIVSVTDKLRGLSERLCDLCALEDDAVSASNPGDDEDFDPPTGAALRLELRYLRRDLASLAQVIERGFDKVSADNATLERARIYLPNPRVGGTLANGGVA